MCIFVCELPAGALSELLISVFASVLYSIGEEALTFTHAVIILTLKT